MQTRYKHIILFAALCLWAMAGRAQTTPQVKENWELNTSESGSPKSYVARDYVSLKPGFRYTAGTGASFNAKVDPGLLFPPTANTYAKPDGTITTDPAQGGVVGAIPGSLGVSPSGSATYTIPIECPPGINGMQPGISLVYSSQGGNGIAGWGWNLSGMSAIGRTGFNLYNDNKIGSPQLTNDDNLTLDGQRLILVSGTNLTDGAKYRTEIEIYSDITYRSINGYTCFEVRTKEGVTMEFGSTADSYIEAQGSSIPLTWLLAKVTDANGNYMTYSYGEDNATGEFWLDKIKYTCNDAAGITTGANEIHFNYTTGRTDSQTSYVAGKKIGQSLLLQSVVTKTNSVTQREYTFSYSIADGFYNKLTSINEKGNDGTKYNPTVIDWNKLGSTTTPEFGYTTSNTGVGSLMNFTMDKTMIFVDLNNDGFVDMIRPTMVMLYSWDYSGWEIYYSTLTTNGRNFVLNQKEDWTEEWKYNRGINPFTGQYQLLPADLNGDGRPDIIEIRQTTSESPQISYCNIDVLLNVNGELVRQNINFSVSGTTNEKFIFEAGDFNGDGETELAAKTYSGGSQIKVYSFDLAASTLTLLGTTSDVSGDLSKSRTTDVNGNGKPEIFTQAGKFIEYDNNSNTFAEIAFAHNLIPTVADLEFGDFNGDGMTDVLQYLSGMNPKWTILMSTGSGFETVSCPLTRTKTTQPQENDPQDFYWVKDFNGDGKADILERAVGSNDVTIYYYNGSSFISHTHTIAGANGFVNDRSLPYYDIDGDGKSDIVNTTATSFSVISFTTPETERSVSAITNGMGVKSTIAYKLLNDNSVYSNGTTVPTTPVVKLCVPMQVVSQTVSGVGNLLETTNYSYKGLRMHLKGKGFLGFEEFTQDNVTQNKKSVSQFGYNETYFNSFPTNQTTSTSAGQAISTTTFINNVIPLDGKRIFPYTASQTSTDNLSGLSSTSTTSRFDDSGNPLTITVTKGDVSETQRMHYIQKGSWCKNKMDTLTVINTLGSETIARKTLYYYDDKGNLIKDIADPADQNSVTNEYKNYDSFGHALLATATSNGITRSTSSTYTISGRFLQSKTNVLGETTTYNWDETKGQLDSESNRFGTTSYSYNGFGSLVETRLPDGIRKAQVLQWAAPDNVIGARYYAYAETSGSTPVTIWYDALGREIQKDSYGLNAKKISVTTEYYSNNQVYRISDPYFEPDAATKVWAKTYTYDMYGRPSTLVTLMGTNSTAYNGKTTTVTTPEGTTETTVNDAGQTFISKVNGKKVTYAYYASGLIKTTTPEGSQAIAMEYDLQGKRTKLTDPDAGIVETKYNGFGEVTEEKQKIHNVTTYITTTNNYAATGLLQSIVRNGETTTYTYDTNNRISTIEIAGKNKQTFTYDAFDRVTNVKEEIGSRVYNTAKEYDVLGRVKKEIYPSGFYTLNSYDGYGNLMEVRDNAGRSIWRANSENARGQLISINKGTKETTFGFDSRGFPTSIVASGVEDMSYSFDSKGNLSYRTDNLTNQSEQFAYDGLNRLTNWNVYQNGVLAKQSGHTYDAATGNITSRSDLGNASGKGDFVYSSMSYGGNRADGTPIGSHALATISPLPDNFPTADLNVAYTDFKKIATLSEGTRYYALTYGVDDQRRKSEYYANGLSQGTPTLTRYYLGDYEEEVNALGNVRKIHYLSGGAMLIQNNGVDSLLYAYSDFQGSLIALADVNGNVVEKYAYDPWGARRNPADWTQKDTRTKWITNRGYTGHEHLDAFGIINMNGRVYDPATAMFMSPDPQLQSPGDWLNYNRYGYCMNNPFKYTDPSGEFWHIIIGAIIGGAINWVSNGCMFNLQGLAYLGAGMAAGAATAAAPGSAMAISAALGMANSVIGQGFDKSGNKFNIKNVEFGLNGVVGAGMMSAVTSYAGGQVGAAMHLDKVLGGISSPILRNVIGGQIGGTVIGGTFGGLSAVANGQDFGQGAWGGAKMGFVTGTIGGIGSGVQFSLDHDVNLFSGKPNPVMPKPTPPALPAHQEQLALPEHIEYPPNDGFQGEIKQDYLMPGDVVDRIGEVGPDSRFLSTKSSSVEMRSLAPNTNTSVYNQYMVAKPIPVTSGKIAPWFNQPGGGLQFRTTVPINTLINRGFLIKF